MGSMTIRNRLIAAVRTASEALAAAGILWLGSRLGIEIPEEAATEVVFATLIAVVTIAVNWLEQRFPFVSKILSWGLSTNGPNYED